MVVPRCVVHHQAPTAEPITARNPRVRLLTMTSVPEQSNAGAIRLGRDSAPRSWQAIRLGRGTFRLKAEATERAAEARKCTGKPRGQIRYGSTHIIQVASALRLPP